MSRAAIFLDRDGVVIENRDNYVRCWEDVAFVPGAIEALVRLAAAAPALVLVTNQSAVGQGLISLTEAHEINHRLVSTIEAAGGRIDGVYMCPHTAEVACDCRKPQPGMLHQAAVDLNLSLSESVLVGDAISDLQAGRSAGLAQLALVQTGRGIWQEHLPEAESVRPFRVFPSLIAAAATLGDLLKEALIEEHEVEK